MKKTRSEQIFESLRQEIGHQPPGTRLGSIRALMRRYKTSQFSVMGALQRLEEAELIFRSTKGELTVCAGGRGGKRRIGIWVPDWPCLVHFQHEENIRRYARKDDMEVVRINYPLNYSFRQMEPEGLSAVILLLLHRLTPQEIYHLGTSPIPVVIMGRILNEVELNFVSTDPFRNGLLAAEYFFRHGHRKLAVALSEPHNSVLDRRCEGFLTFARAIGCTARVIDCNVYEGENSAVSTHEAFSKLLKESFPQFTGLYMLSGATAFSAISALTEAGYRVPDDVSVIAADNLDQAAYFLPPVTCVDANMDEYAKRVVENVKLLLGEHGNGCCREIIESRVIERASVRTIPPETRPGKKTSFDSNMQPQNQEM